MSDTNNAAVAVSSTPAKIDRYAKKHQDRIRQTAAHDALDVAAGDVSASMTDRLGQEVSVSVRRSENRRYANVLFNVTIENDSVQTTHEDMTAAEVHIFFAGISAMGIWMVQPAGGSAPVEAPQEDVVVPLTLNPPHAEMPATADLEPATEVVSEPVVAAAEGTDDSDPADYATEVLA